ncbi:MAG: hypothetical protein WBW11_20630, partial [Pseudolabrys sp.]
GERPRGTIIELCSNAGRSRGLAHAWRHRIWSGQHFQQGVTLPSGYQRPWTRVTVSAVAVGQGANQPAPRDASPRSEFLEADD